LNLLHRTGLRDRVYGPELTLRLAGQSGRLSLPVYLFGSTPPVLARFEAALRARFPDLAVAGATAPARWPWSSAQDAQYVRQIRASGARVVFVGLGCPRQEQWVVAHRQALDAVLVAVGAAFDFISGTKRQAPSWMQKAGLEMVFRACTEPARLAGRLIRYSPAFVVLVLAQWVKQKTYRSRACRQSPTGNHKTCHTVRPS
jgi:exopolysaccharide biosynthesis WecB/TagA/CpsF family protein